MTLDNRNKGTAFTSEEDKEAFEFNTRKMKGS